MSIGLFDSGVGGLTVMREVVRLLPHENIIYLGDTARLPYGNKSADAILRFSMEAAEFLMKKEIKLLIVACHTASVWALGSLQKLLPVPVIGVVECSISRVLQTTKTNEIAVLGTKSTIDSRVHASLIRQLRPSMKIHPIACPLFVPFVEEGLLDHPATELIARHYLGSLSAGVDLILLACTHYPLLHSLIQKVVGSKITLIEPAIACAEEVRSLLAEKKLLSKNREKPHYEFYSTDAPDQFHALASRFFGAEIKEVKLKVLSS